jgi:hypothetical protein
MVTHLEKEIKQSLSVLRSCHRYFRMSRFDILRRLCRQGDGEIRLSETTNVLIRSYFNQKPIDEG